MTFQWLQSLHLSVTLSIEVQMMDALGHRFGDLEGEEGTKTKRQLLLLNFVYWFNSVQIVFQFFFFSTTISNKSACHPMEFIGSL